MRMLPMSTTTIASRGGRALAGALLGALALAVAAPALAGSVYRWETPEGGVAFTDDPERIPVRHREAAQSVEVRGLEGYARYTPRRAGGASDYEERLAARLERLRRLNAPAREARSERVPDASAPGGGAVLELGGAASLRVPTPSEGGDAEPVVVEEVRVREPGESVTKTDTVVRQGDRVLVVVSPINVPRSRPGSVPSESEILERELSEGED